MNYRVLKKFQLTWWKQKVHSEIRVWIHFMWTFWKYFSVVLLYKNGRSVCGNFQGIIALVIYRGIICFAFWVMSPCGLLGDFQHYGETYCLPWRWRQNVFLFCWYSSIWLHCVMIQKTTVCIFIAMAASDLIHDIVLAWLSLWIDKIIVNH
jgi:hypothetical protein